MISDYFSALPILHQAFWYLAFFASLIFLFQTVMTFVGGHSGDFDTDFGGEFHHGEMPFELFTFRNLINFLLGFGWTGVAFFGELNNTILVIFAFLVGLVFVGIFFVIIKQFLKLQEDNTFNINNTLGKTAQVYVPIPAQKTGSGKVQLSINGSFHELEAMTENLEKINSGENVRIVKLENEVLFVEKI